MEIRWRNWHGFVVFENLDIPDGGALQVEYRDEASGRFYPCCMMPNLTEEELQRPCNVQDWNFATQSFGYIAKYLVRDDRVYWNYPLDFDGIPAQREKTVRLRRVASVGRTLSDDIFTVTIDPGATVYLHNWQEWTNVSPEPYTHLRHWRVTDPTDVPAGWYVASDAYGFPRLTSFGMEKLPPVSYSPQLNGRYDVYLGFRETESEMIVRLPGGVTREIRLDSRNIPGKRFNREIYLDAADFKPEDRIEIARRPAAEINKLHRFGDLLYIKLIPAGERQLCPPAALPEDFETVFYSEPETMSYFNFCQNEQDVAKIADHYCELGVDKVICESGRIGARMLHRGSIAGAVLESTRGDDLQYSGGVAEAIRNMDVMRVMADACRSRGLVFLAEAGINSPYRGTALASRWITEHPEYIHPRHPIYLDFGHEEVREFAATVYAELAGLPVDGIAFNCTRYPYGMTAEYLIDVVHRFAAKIGEKRRRELELHFSIVAGLPEFYTALETLLAEGLVDSLCVGLMTCFYPTVDLRPFRKLLDRYPGKKLYGKIDGWMPNHAGLNQMPLPRPADCAAQVKEYLRAGANGVFFYQSDQILIDPFLERFVKSLKA